MSSNWKMFSSSSLMKNVSVRQKPLSMRCWMTILIWLHGNWISYFAASSVQNSWMAPSCFMAYLTNYLSMSGKHYVPMTVSHGCSRSILRTKPKLPSSVLWASMAIQTVLCLVSRALTRKRQQPSFMNCLIIRLMSPFVTSCMKTAIISSMTMISIIA